MEVDSLTVVCLVGMDRERERESLLLRGAARFYVYVTSSLLDFP